MAADRSAAGWAAPLLLLRLQKVFHTRVAYGVKIFDHAHVILRAVALIQALQALAGVIRTFKTEPNLAFAEQIAGIRHVGAVFPAGDAARAVGSVKTLLIQVQCSE